MRCVDAATVAEQAVHMNHAVASQQLIICVFVCSHQLQRSCLITNRRPSLTLPQTPPAAGIVVQGLSWLVEAVPSAGKRAAIDSNSWLVQGCQALYYWVSRATSLLYPDKYGYFHVGQVLLLDTGDATGTVRPCAGKHNLEVCCLLGLHLYNRQHATINLHLVWISATDRCSVPCALHLLRARCIVQYAKHRSNGTAANAGIANPAATCWVGITDRCGATAHVLGVGLEFHSQRCLYAFCSVVRCSCTCTWCHGWASGQACRATRC